MRGASDVVETVGGVVDEVGPDSASIEIKWELIFKPFNQMNKITWWRVRYLTRL